MPLYAPRYGIIVEGRPYQGGEPIDPQHEEASYPQLRAHGAHEDANRALFDNVNYPHPTAKELKGDPEKGIEPVRPVPYVGAVPYAPDARPELTDVELSEFPKTGNSKALSHDDVTRILLVDAGLEGDLLDPHETRKFTRKQAENFVEVFNTQAAPIELAGAAKAGEAKREWYSMAAKALVGLFGDQASRFAALLAATSTKNGVRDNLNQAALWFKWYIGHLSQAGRQPFPDEVEAAAQSLEGKGAGKVAFPARLKNVVRVLTAQDEDFIQPGSKPSRIETVLSGLKVSSFHLNLLGYTRAATVDVWQAVLAGFDQKKVEDLGGYLASTVRIRQATDLLNAQRKAGEKKWTPAEVQATAWSTIRGLAFILGQSRKDVRRTGDPSKLILPRHAPDHLTHELIREQADFLRVLFSDQGKIARDALQSLGLLGRDLNRIEREYQAFVEKQGRSRTFRGGVGRAVESLGAGPYQELLGPIASRAGHKSKSLRQETYQRTGKGAVKLSRGRAATPRHGRARYAKPRASKTADRIAHHRLGLLTAGRDFRSRWAYEDAIEAHHQDTRGPMLGVYNRSEQSLVHVGGSGIRRAFEEYSHRPSYDSLRGLVDTVHNYFSDARRGKGPLDRNVLDFAKHLSQHVRRVASHAFQSTPRKGTAYGALHSHPNAAVRGILDSMAGGAEPEAVDVGALADLLEEEKHPHAEAARAWFDSMSKNSSYQDGPEQLSRATPRHGLPKRYAQQPTPQAQATKVDNDFSFNQAAERTRSEDLKAFKDEQNQLLKRLGLNARSYEAVADWEDGAEPSVLNEIPHQADERLLEYAAAWQGLLGNQKSVLYFVPHPSGKDSTYTLDLQDTDLDRVRRHLNAHSIPYRTIVPRGKKTRVVIYDQQRRLRPNVSQFAQRYNAHVHETIGRGNYLGGATRSAARAAYRAIIDRYEGKTTDPTKAGKAGREVHQDSQAV